MKGLHNLPAAWGIHLFMLIFGLELGFFFLLDDLLCMSAFFS
jgi:hypothetical protein